MSTAVRSETPPETEPPPETDPETDETGAPAEPPTVPPSPPDTDEPGDTPASEDEPEPEPPPVQAALSEKEINKRVDALESEKRRHAKRIGEILQEEALDLIECEACEAAIPGFHYPAAMYQDGSPERALYEMLAGGADVQMQHPARYVTCDTCNGFGQVLTGARNDLNRLIICDDCKGAGYHDRETQRPPALTLAPQSPVVPSAVPAPEALPEVDFLGRPAGHVNYGKNTAYLTPAELAIDQRDGFGIS